MCENAATRRSCDRPARIPERDVEGPGAPGVGTSDEHTDACGTDDETLRDRQLTVPWLLTRQASLGRLDLRRVLLIALCGAAGLGALAVADEASRRGHAYTPTSVLFWAGLLLVFAPAAIRALAPAVDRRERLGIIVGLGVALYLVKVLASPDAFTFSDEYVHLRNTQDILRTHHLFAFNPLLPTASYYPGLAALTAGLVQLTGLGTFTAGVLVIAIARVLFGASFYLVVERVTGSSRAAAVAGLVYAANPMFLFWSAAFSYENLALPLVAFVVWWIGRTRGRGDPAATVVAAVGVLAVTVTHHVAGFALAALLGAWWLAERLGRTSAQVARRRVGLLALLAGAATLTWFLAVARPAPGYLLSHNLGPALRQTGSLLLGHTAPRKLYRSGGLTSPAWEPVAGFVGIAVLLLALLAALPRAWWLRHRAPLAVATTLAVAYPFSLLPRLAPSGVAISGRSSEYVFAGLGCVLGLLVAGATSRAPRRPGDASGAAAVSWTWVKTLVAALLATVVFVGDVTVGTAFYQRLPEARHPHGYPWSVQPDVIAASRWARAYLGINRRFGAGAIDSFALATYGEQHTLDEDRIWPIFFAGSMSRSVVERIRTVGVQYLLIDWRMTHGVPPTPGHYFSPQEPGAGEYRRRFPIAGLQKFSAAPCTRLIYRSGAVQIYDVSRIETGACASLPGRPTRAGEAS